MLARFRRARLHGAYVPRHGKDGYLLETPQQWGKKSTTNVLTDPTEVDAFVDLILHCAKDAVRRVASHPLN